jgi:high-affinity Fe2+/Pb2+ permease
VGNPDTIGHRTELYFLMMAMSIVATIAAIMLARRLTPSIGGWNAVLTSVGAYVVAVGLVAWLLPVVDEVPADFPADLLWQFRIASLTVETSLWLVTGLALATMIAAVVRRASAHNEARVLTGGSV